MFDLMIHDIDYAMWLAGDVTSVYAKEAPGGPGHAIAVLQHERRRQPHRGILVRAAAGVPDALGDRGDRGRHRVLVRDAASPLTVRLHEAGSDATTGIDDHTIGTNPFELELQHFLDRIDHGAAPVITAAAAAEAVRVAEATRQSVLTSDPSG